METVSGSMMTLGGETRECLSADNAVKSSSGLRELRKLRYRSKPSLPTWGLFAERQGVAAPRAFAKRTFIDGE